MKTHHVQVIPVALAAEIRARLEEDGLRLGSVPYADYEMIGSDVRVTFYPKRRKLLIQGNGTAGMLTRLGDLLGDAAPEEEEPWARIDVPTIGSDETGKGDYFGPLVVCACLVTPADVAKLRQLGVRDSKDVGDTQILAAEAQIERLVPVAVCELDPVEYGRLHEQTKNVNRILGMAHARVIRELLGRGACERVVIDRFGREEYVVDELGPLDEPRPAVVQVSKAEQNLAVAAASFVARARFVRALGRLSDEVGVDLLPGASAAVEEVARKVYAVGGLELLGKAAKLHFKTTGRVVASG